MKLYNIRLEGGALQIQNDDILQRCWIESASVNLSGNCSILQNTFAQCDITWELRSSTRMDLCVFSGCEINGEFHHHTVFNQTDYRISGEILPKGYFDQFEKDLEDFEGMMISRETLCKAQTLKLQYEMFKQVNQIFNISRRMARFSQRLDTLIHNLEKHFV